MNSTSEKFWFYFRVIKKCKWRILIFKTKALSINLFLLTDYCAMFQLIVYQKKWHFEFWSIPETFSSYIQPSYIRFLPLMRKKIIKFVKTCIATLDLLLTDTTATNRQYNRMHNASIPWTTLPRLAVHTLWLLFIFFFVYITMYTRASAILFMSPQDTNLQTASDKFHQSLQE